MLIELEREGLFCRSGGFHIDPCRGVERALVTHAHSDHARGGSTEYFCASPGAGLLAARLGARAKITGVPYGQSLQFGNVKVSFHPAGHVLGSAQIRVESGGEVWVASGDFKRDQDLSCAPFEVVACDTFITEATFGSPLYEWDDPALVVRDLFDWWEDVRAEGSTAVLFCYALGKAQRVLADLTKFTDREVLVSPEIEVLNRCYREEGVSLLPTRDIGSAAGASLTPQSLKGQLLVTTPQYFSSARGGLDRLGRIRTAVASGWVKTGRFGKRSNDRAFALSDHADWPDLIRTVEETGARSVYVLGDSSERLSHALRNKGLFASRMTLRAQGAQDKHARRVPIQGELFARP